MPLINLTSKLLIIINRLLGELVFGLLLVYAFSTRMSSKSKTNNWITAKIESQVGIYNLHHCDKISN
jgi:hypothetical protein